MKALNIKTENKDKTKSNFKEIQLHKHTYIYSSTIIQYSYILQIHNLYVCKCCVCIFRSLVSISFKTTLI